MAGGFTPGELFTGAGTPGVIARISPDGNTVQNPWIPRGLFQDRVRPGKGALRLTLRLTFANPSDRIVLRAVGLRLSKK
jgi:hypothetical protein